MASIEWQERVIEKKLHTCKHYNGAVNPACLAGVNYKELTGGGAGWGLRLPCNANSPHVDPAQVKPCASRESPTLEEVQAEVERFSKSWDNTTKARQAITDYLKADDKPSRNVSGAIPCPICNGGTLRFSIAYNGHCHGTCSTPSCVSWME